MVLEPGESEFHRSAPFGKVIRFVHGNGKDCLRVQALAHHGRTASY
ncbi:hypothetical protein EPIB2_905 [Tritonibacter mobilis]|nr:hypothetical protein EPIB2_905 [Tritonibacter mobilis]